MNYIAVNPTDVKANVQGQSHNSSYLFMDKEKNKRFSFPSDFERRKTALRK